MKMLKKEEKGVTLIALIVTIIVLIILAVVSLNFLLGNNGLLNKAGDAKRIQAVADAVEKTKLAIAALLIENKGDSTKIMPNDIGEQIKKEGTNVSVDRNEYPATITFPDNIEVEVDKDLNVNGKGETSTPEEPEVPVEKVESSSSLWNFTPATKTINFYIGDFTEFKDGVVVVPNYIDGVAVETVGNGEDRVFNENLAGEKLLISRGIRKIGIKAFSGLQNNTNGFILEIGDTVKELGKEAFSWTTIKEGINIPNSIETITDSSFMGVNLKSGNIMTGNNTTKIEQSAFSYMNFQDVNSQIIMKDRLKIIGTCAFGNMYNIQGGITIPDSVTVIESSAFIYDTSFNGKLILSKNLQSIGANAFQVCGFTGELVIPDSVTKIEKEAFWGCESFTKITVGENLNTLETKAFATCSKVETIELSTKNKNFMIESGILFNKDKTELVYCPAKIGITSYKIPDSVERIGEYAFERCVNMVAVEIPSKVTKIPGNTFEYCTNLTNINIPTSITEISQYAFYHCDKLENITIPITVNEIGGSAFGETIWYKNQPNGMIYINDIAYKYKGALPSSYTIKSGIKKIGDSAFSEGNDKNLRTIVLPEGVEKIGYESFSRCQALTNVTLPSTLKEIGWNAFRDCELLSNITLPNSLTKIEKGAFWNCKSLTSVTIPGGVTEIGGNAFFRCIKLKTVNFSEGLKSIGDEAFDECTVLSNITIPTTVTNIGNSAFKSCKALTNITIPKGVTKINTSTFGYCTNLSSITLPEGLETIELYAFESCTSLSSITIPSSVTNIGDYAFSSWTSSQTINIKGKNSPPITWSIGWNDKSSAKVNWNK